MGLDQKGKDVLSIMHDVNAEGFEMIASKLIGIREDEIGRIVRKLVRLGLVEILLLNDGLGTRLYLRTPLVKDEMLNDDLRYLSDSGARFGENRKDHPIAQLREFQKNKSRTFHKVIRKK